MEPCAPRSSLHPRRTRCVRLWTPFGKTMACRRVTSAPAAPRQRSACGLRLPPRARGAHSRAAPAAYREFRFGEAQARCSECMRSRSSLLDGLAFGCARLRGSTSCTTPAPSRSCSASSFRSRAYAAAAPAPVGYRPTLTRRSLAPNPLRRYAIGASPLSVQTYRARAPRPTASASRWPRAAAASTHRMRNCRSVTPQLTPDLALQAKASRAVSAALT